MKNVTQSLLGMIFERTIMLIIEKRITNELVQKNIKELKSIHCLEYSIELPYKEKLVAK
jgi:hypothetical protein